MNPASVVCQLNYLSERETHPESHVARWGSGAPARWPEQTAHEVRIHDCREIAAELSLDAQGFVLRRDPSAVCNFYDADEVARVYYPEVERLVRDVAGATRVVVFERHVRNATKAASGLDGARPPFHYVHSDDTDASVRARILGLLGPSEGESWLRHRVATFTVWRPIVAPVYDTPLALCDAASIAPADLVVTSLIYGGNRTAEVYSVRHNPAHRWYYASAMQTDEVLLFKSFDSARDGRARFTPHSAFRNPAGPPGGRERESIEVRTVALFEAAA